MKRKSPPEAVQERERLLPITTLPMVNKPFVWLGKKYTQPISREMWTVQAVGELGVWIVVIL